MRKALFVLLVFANSGCGLAYLRDTRTPGLKNCFFGLEPVESMAYARDIQAQTDDRQKLIEIRGQLLTELSDPKTTSERRQLIYSDLELIEKIISGASLKVRGTVTNYTARHLHVEIYQLPEEKLAASADFVGAGIQEVRLPVGYRYKTVCTDIANGQTWHYENKNPVTAATGWRTWIGSPS